MTIPQKRANSPTLQARRAQPHHQWNIAMRNTRRSMSVLFNRFRFRRTAIVVLLFIINGLTHDAVGQVQSAVGQALIGAFRGVIGP